MLTPVVDRARHGDREAFGALTQETGDRCMADGELSLTSATSGVCRTGDVGTYPWSLSPGGTLLTIEPGTDDCAARAQVVPGTYERSACKDSGDWCLGELEAGEYLSHYFEPRPQGEWAARHGALTYAVPEGWASYADWPGVYGLTTASEYEAYNGVDCFDCDGSRDMITLLGQPGAATPDCLETNVPGIGFGRQDLVDWLTTHPGLIATDIEDWTVGGLAATSLIIEPVEDWTGTCDTEQPFGAVPVFFRQDDGYHWALNVGARWHVTLIDLGGGDTVAVVVDAADDENLEAFVEDALPIVETFEFPAR